MPFFEQRHVCLLLVSLLCFCGMGAASQLYVRTTGHNVPNCGTQQVPCASIRYAISLTAENDVVHVYGGVYKNEGNNSHVVISHSLQLTSMGDGTVNVQCGTNQNKLLNITGSADHRPTVKIYGFSFTQCIHADDLLSSAIVASNAEIMLYECSFSGNGMIVYHAQLGSDSCDYLRVYVTNSTFVTNVVSKPYYEPALTLAGCQTLFVQIYNTTFTTSPLRLMGEQNLTAQFQNVTFDGFQLKGAGVDIETGLDANSIIFTNCTVTNHDHGRETPVLIAAAGQPKQHPILHMTGVMFINNHYTKSMGGALAVVARLPNKPLFMNMNLKQCHFFNNSATRDGGAIYVENVSAFEVNQCSFYQNNASKGGAIKIYKGASINITNSTMIMNHAFDLQTFDYLTIGGAIYVDGATLIINGCTFKHNVARYSATDVFIQNSPFVSIQQSYFENSFSGLAGLQTGLLTIRSLDEDWPKKVVAQLNNNVFNATAERDHTLLDIQARSVLKGNEMWCRTGQNIQMSKIPGDDPLHPNSYKHLVQWCQTCPQGTCTHTEGHMVDDGLDSPWWNSSNTCQPCPQHGSCAYGQAYADPNYWGYKQDSELSLQLCPLEYCCDQACRGYNICSIYRTGKLCSECIQDYVSEAGTGRCVNKTDCITPGLPWTLVIVVVFAFFYLGLLLCNTRLGNLIYQCFGTRSPRETDGNAENGGGRLLNEDVDDDVLLEADSESEPDNQDNADDRLLFPGQVGDSASWKAEKSVFHLHFNVILIMSFLFFQLAPLVYGFNADASSIANRLVQAINDMFYLRPWFTLFGSMCSFASLRYTGVILMNLCAVIALYIALGLVYLVTYAVMYISTRRDMTKRKEKLTKLKTSFMFTFTLLVLLTHVPLVSVVSQLVQCVPLGNEWVMYMDAMQTCYQPWHYVVIVYLAACAAQLFLAIAIGGQSIHSSKISLPQFAVGCLIPPVIWIPLLVHAIRRRCQTFNQPHLLHSFNPATERLLLLLQAPFCSKSEEPCATHCAKLKQNWYGVIVLRCTSLTLFAIFLAHLPVLKSIIVLVLCILMLFHHGFSKPYKSNVNNAIEAITLLLLTLFAVMGTHRSVAYAEGDEVSGIEASLITFYGWFYAVVLILTAALMLVCFLLIITVPLLRGARRRCLLNRTN